MADPRIDAARQQANTYRREHDQLRARIAAVLALHPAAPPHLGPVFCEGCGEAVPCPTRQALEGDA